MIYDIIMSYAYGDVHQLSYVYGGDVAGSGRLVLKKWWVGEKVSGWCDFEVRCAKRSNIVI